MGLEMVPTVLTREKAMDDEWDVPTRTSQTANPKPSMAMEASFPWQDASTRQSQFSRSMHARKRARSNSRPTHSLMGPSPVERPRQITNPPHGQLYKLGGLEDHDTSRILPERWSTETGARALEPHDEGLRHSSLFFHTKRKSVPIFLNLEEIHSYFV